MELDVLSGSLREYPVPDAVRETLLFRLWGAPGEPDNYASQHDMSPYFEFYSKRIHRLLLDGGRHACVKTHLGIVEIARKILDGSTREELHQELQNYSGCAESSDQIDVINNTIDLCGALLVMAEIGKTHTGVSGRASIIWKTKSLRATLAGYFAPQRTLTVDNSKLGKLFTGRNLSRLGGIKILWTTNLADHLRLIDDDQAVFIFHSTTFLKFQASLDNGPFPDGFLEETLQTLALLFPSTDKKTKAWLQAQKKPAKIDQTLGRCGALRTHERRLEKFSFWHDRLVILKQAFDESQPRTLSQWWFDRRNRVQWYTFWVAVLVFTMTIFFGTIQSVEGALQVYMSYEALHQTQQPNSATVRALTQPRFSHLI